MPTCEELTREVLRRSRVRQRQQRRRRAIVGTALCTLLVVSVWAVAERVRPTIQPAESEPAYPADSATPVRYSAVARGGTQHPAETAGGDRVAFSETDCLQNITAMVEGKILSVAHRQLEYREMADGRGELQRCIFTVVYTLRVEQVFWGDFAVGQTLTFENTVDGMDPPQWLAVGGQYVLPLYTAGERLYPAYQAGVTGNLDRVSPYALWYPWHSQMETARDGYLVPTDWSTLCAGKDVRPVILDGDGAWQPEPVYVPAATFAANMQALLAQKP